MVALALTLGGCERPIEALAPTRAVVPEGLTSDRQLPLRPWTPELHPTPGKDGAPAFAEKLTLAAAVSRAPFVRSAPR